MRMNQSFKQRYPSGMWMSQAVIFGDWHQAFDRVPGLQMKTSLCLFIACQYWTLPLIFFSLYTVRYRNNITNFVFTDTGVYIKINGLFLNIIFYRAIITNTGWLIVPDICLTSLIQFLINLWPFHSTATLTQEENLPLHPGISTRHWMKQFTRSHNDW